LGKSNSKARYLDLGCCFATDTRQVMMDGWNPKNLFAVDIVDDYWKFGLNLFKDAETLPIESRFGNVITDEKLCKDIGQFNVIWTGQVLHVLNQSDVEQLIRRIFSLLESGGIYFGTCVCADTPGEWKPSPTIPVRYLHSLESLKALLTDIGFVNVEIQQSAHAQDNSTNSGSFDTSRARGILSFKAQKP